VLVQSSHALFANQGVSVEAPVGAASAPLRHPDPGNLFFGAMAERHEERLRHGLQLFDAMHSADTCSRTAIAGIVRACRLGWISRQTNTNSFDHKLRANGARLAICEIAGALPKSPKCRTPRTCNKLLPSLEACSTKKVSAAHPRPRLCNPATTVSEDKACLKALYNNKFYWLSYIINVQTAKDICDAALTETNQEWVLDVGQNISTTFDEFIRAFNQTVQHNLDLQSQNHALLQMAMRENNSIVEELTDLHHMSVKRALELNRRNDEYWQQFWEEFLEDMVYITQDRLFRIRQDVQGQWRATEWEQT